MHRLGTFLLSAAVCVALGVPLLVVAALLHGTTVPWLITLMQYQSLTAALATLFTGGLALAGVLATVSANRRQRVEDAETERRRIAAAFIGEINVILRELRDEQLVPTLENTRTRLDREPMGALLPVVRLTADFTIFYRGNSKEVGRFAAPLPEDLTRFYGLFVSIKAKLEHIWASLTPGAPDAMTREMASIAVGNTIKEIKEALQLGDALVSKLTAARDAKT